MIARLAWFVLEVADRAYLACDEDVRAFLRRAWRTFERVVT